jgi:cytochrome c oxidase cbb3-type subunit 3
VSKNTDELLGHAEDNDGIEEYDNPLPDWWIGMFILSIIFAVGYSVEYHFISQRSQEGAYTAQMEAAKVQWPQNANAAAVTTDAKTIEDGKAIYTQNCAACHGADRSGGIGPNLIDAEWIHGGQPDQVIATITNGVGDKGMPAWGPILGPGKVSAVASFVLSQDKE